MNGEHTRQGHVTKIVRVPPAPESLGGASPNLEGYGILRSIQGEDVFFVGTVVSEGRFAELEIGDSICFTLEPGPLLRAARVWVPPADSPTQPTSMARVRS